MSTTEPETNVTSGAVTADALRNYFSLTEELLLNIDALLLLLEMATSEPLTDTPRHSVAHTVEAYRRSITLARAEVNEAISIIGHGEVACMRLQSGGAR